MSKNVINRTNALAVLFFIIIIILSGCGGTGGGGEHDYSTNTNTETAIEPGTYHIYAHRNVPCTYPAVGYFDYEIRIEQEAGSDEATIWKDTQYLTCDADNTSKTLSCTGQFIFEDEETYNTTFEYTLYHLRQLSGGDLIGDTEYEVFYSGMSGSCNSEGELMTQQPNYGSFLIRNGTSNYTLNYVEFIDCGADLIGVNELDTDDSIIPDHAFYFQNMTPACYDVFISVDREPTSDSPRVLITDQNLEGGKTLFLPIIDEESNLLHTKKFPK